MTDCDAPPHAALSAEDWTLLAEGAVNVVLAYSGSEERLRHKVLRVRKAVSGSHIGVALSPRSSCAFIAREYGGLLGELVTDTVAVAVDAAFLGRIAERIESSRAERRRVHAIDRAMSHAIMCTNFLPRTARSFTVELKPKCGFVAEGHAPRAAQGFCRFCMHQYLKIALGQLSARSEYCPLQMFSPCRVARRAALLSMLRTPQNNAAVFAAGSARVLAADGSVDSAALDELQRVLAACGALQHAAEWRDAVVAVVDDALERANVLPRLLAAQHLDRIGFERAAALYDAGRGAETNAVELNAFLLGHAAKDCSIMIAFEVDSDGALRHRLGIVDLDPRPMRMIPAYWTLDQQIAAAFADAVRSAPAPATCVDRVRALEAAAPR